MKSGLGKQAFFLAISCVLFSKTLQAASCENLDDWKMALVEEESLLISQLRVNNLSVSEGLEVYLYKDTFLLPVSIFNQLLQLGWDLDQKVPSIAFVENQDIPDMCSFSITLPRLQGQNGLFWALWSN